MDIDVCIITGLMFGFEYVDVEELDARHLVIDFAFLRVLISF